MGWDGVSVYNDTINDVPRYYIPSVYQRVEYVDSKEGAYFQTPLTIYANQTISVQSKIQYIGTGTDNIWLAGDGMSHDNSQFEIGVFGRNWYTPNGATQNVEVINQASKPAQQLIKISLERKYNSTENLTWRLFGRYGFGEGPNGLFDTRIYSLIIQAENVAIFCFIPCRRKSDNKPGMYDTVSGEFFTNQGTGEFICGPDVGETIAIDWSEDIGTVYGGWVDLISGEVCEEYEKKVFDGSENWGLNTWSKNGVYIQHREVDFESRVVPYVGTTANELYCNMLQSLVPQYYINTNKAVAIVGSDFLPNYTYLLIYNSEWGQTIEEYKTAIKALYDNGTPLEVVAKRKTAYF